MIIAHIKPLRGHFLRISEEFCRLFETIHKVDWGGGIKKLKHFFVDGRSAASLCWPRKSSSSSC